MNLRYAFLSIANLIVLESCNPTDSMDAEIPETEEIATPRILTPIPAPDEYLAPLAPSNIARLWANTGEDKVTRDELRASLDPNRVLNSAWDGTSISLLSVNRV